MKLLTNKDLTDMTEDQLFCVETLCDWALGRHHLPKVHQFGNGVCVNWSGDLSTFDFDGLTRLVLIAHRDAVRIEISSSGPGMIRIIAHRREHVTNEKLPMHKMHPTLDDLIKQISKFKPCNANLKDET